MASQAISEPAYGPRCLDAMAEGATAATALDAAMAADPMAALRQVGAVAADGSGAATTGELCIDHAGHQLGDGFAVQGNMMRSPEVWPAMAEAFTAATGPLAQRLLATLAAGEAAGGDARGRMSAALVVVEGVVPGTPGGGTVVDLRVDRSEDPIGDLARLLVAADSYAGFGRAVDQLSAATRPARGSPSTMRSPCCPASRTCASSAPAPSSRPAPARRVSPSFRSLVAEQPGWGVVVRGFVAKGLVALPEGVDIDAVLG